MGLSQRLARLEEKERSQKQQEGARGVSPFWTSEGHLSISAYIPKSLDDRLPVWPSFIPEGWPEYVECPRCRLPRGCRIWYWYPEMLVQWNTRLTDDAIFPLPLEVRTSVKRQLEAAGFTLEDVLSKGPRTRDAFEIVWRDLLIQYSSFDACEFVIRDGMLKLAPLVPERFGDHLSYLQCEPRGMIEGVEPEVSEGSVG